VNAPLIALSRRLRNTPFTSRIERFGVQAYTVYNHMLLPSRFRGLEEDYWHLRNAVQIWDVACERQVQLKGPDAARLAQLLTVRDISGFDVGRGGLVPVCDHDGHLINDPVVFRVADDCYWFSISDSDVALWAGGLALGMGLDVEVSEPDVNPLAVQGRHSDDVLAKVFGDSIRETKFFRFATHTFKGHPLRVARSGWSAQGGFEIFVDDWEIGAQLYDAICEAGAPYDIGPGCPNLIERIEAGLMTYGTDITREHTPLEGGMEKYCSLDSSIDAIGLDALRAQRASGVTRKIIGVMAAGDRVPAQRDPWPIRNGERVVGSITSITWSPRLECNVGLGMVETSSTPIGTTLTLEAPDGTRNATVCAVPFVGASQR
jgi:dimethylsulfoniopropionate demethylase